MGVKHLAPKDVARLLTEAGIPTHEKAIRRRCTLRKGTALRIETNPEFPGRFYIPETELKRLLGVRAEVSA